MRNCKFLPRPKSLPQGEGLEFDFSSLADFQHHCSHSLADGARGWVSSLQGESNHKSVILKRNTLCEAKNPKHTKLKF